MTWKNRLQPASFRGARFHVEDRTLETGRGGPVHEYPMRDTPYAEDMGKRARRVLVRGYVIGADYDIAMRALIAACEAPGPGMLVHPTLGAMRMKCELCAATETRIDGRMALFDMEFVEAGSSPSPTVAPALGAGLVFAAAALASRAIAALDAKLG